MSSQEIKSNTAKAVELAPAEQAAKEMRIGKKFMSNLPDLDEEEREEYYDKFREQGEYFCLGAIQQAVAIIERYKKFTGELYILHKNADDDIVNIEVEPWSEQDYDSEMLDEMEEKLL